MKYNAYYSKYLQNLIKKSNFVANYNFMSAKFGSKIGLIAATVGSAVGLGNIWRFPAEAQTNGGAAFLLVYIACLLIIGIPVMIGEFVIGREGGTDAVGDYKRISPKKKWWLIGGIGVVASYLILCFYIVVAGWSLEYLFNSVTGELFAGIADGSSSFEAKIQDYTASDWKPLIFTAGVILLNIIILLGGVRKGIEKMSNIMMPMLYLILIVFCAVTLTLPNAGEGVNFFLSPDFSKIGADTVINALGQAFFSLSLGTSILITYAAYYPKHVKLGKTATTVTLLDMSVSVMMGLVIFPAVTSFGLQGESIEGATLVFATLPEVFMHMPGTQFWAILFFLLLLLAALTSTVSIAEVSVRFFQDRLKMRRRNAVLAVLLPRFIFSSLCSLSTGALSDIKIFGLTIFDFLDTFATNILLPLGSMAMCIYLGWFAPKGWVARQMGNGSASKSFATRMVAFIIKWVAPIAIASIFIAQFN